MIILLAIAFQLAAEGFDLAPLFNTGGAVAVLAFVLFRLEPRLRGIEKSNDRMTRALLVVTMSLKHLDDLHHEQAQKILDEIEESEEG